MMKFIGNTGSTDSIVTDNRLTDNVYRLGVHFLQVYMSMDWEVGATVVTVLIEQCFTSRQHSIGYMGDIFTGQKTYTTVSKY